MDSDARRWEGPERRSNLRQRKLIDDLQAGVNDNRAAIAALTIRVHQLEDSMSDVTATLKPSA